jgi:indole-3-glycerol phosphate synthase
LTDILSKIIEVKRGRVAAARAAVPIAELRLAAREARSKARSHRLLAALNNERINIIAEIKRASPSKGVIRDHVDPPKLARSYESGGAAAISILTEEDHFHGALDDLRAVRNSVAIPLLRKDFIFEEYQVYESAAAGADALLLIVAGLSDEQLAQLRQVTEDELGMDALIEVHTAAEMARAINCGAGIIGVNNRDLTTFEVSLTTSVSLAAAAPSGLVRISESGLDSATDILRLRDLGYRGFLIGESLMRSEDPETMLASLTQTMGVVSS